MHVIVVTLVNMQTYYSHIAGTFVDGDIIKITKAGNDRIIRGVVIKK